MGYDENQYKQALFKAAEKIKELDSKLKELESTDEIAVIGYSCRFPDGANSPALFWEKLSNGYDAVSEISADRFNYEPVYQQGHGTPGKTYTKYASFLDYDIKQFDNTHFEISPVESISTDPQQRLLLEVSWDALEQAGLDIMDLKGSKTGVFIGIDGVDYFMNEISSGDLYNIKPHSLVGFSSHAAAGRLSYFYDFKGPAVCISTACSSSITAMSTAVDNLRTRKCDLAIVGGVNLLLNPEAFVALSQFNALSPDGRCKTFDASADGFGRGEGCGIVILKRQDDAKRDQNTVEAIVKSIYIGQDGRANGFFAPNGLAEQRVIDEALKNSSLTVEDIDYIEAHGTGTTLGDFIEAQAISDVFKKRSKPILCGSVKSNIGHLEAAAGMASIIKVLLSLRHRKIPPSIHYHTPNQNIDWERVKVVDSLREWKPNRDKRRAGINSFGISGALAHIILEEPDHQIQDRELELTDYIITLSARQENAICPAVSELSDFLEITTDKVGDIAYSTNITKDKNKYRFAIVGSGNENIAKEMKSILADENAKSFYFGEKKNQKPKIAFLFTGQGSIYRDAALEFYESISEYKNAFDKCEDRFRELLGISMKETLYSADRELKNALYSQPVIFTLEYSLAAIWESLDIQPDYVIGHSIGEYAALCYSGVLDFSDATKMIAVRSRIMSQVPPEGKMVGVLTSKENIEKAIVDSGCEKVSIAAINAPNNVTISGPRDEVDKVLEQLHKKIRTFVDDLGIPYPYHSITMGDYQEEYSKNLDSFQCNKGKMRIISTVSGQEEDYSRFEEKAYWTNHLEKTVFFEKAVKTAENAGVSVFIEIGGNATLIGLAKQCVKNEEAVFVPTIRKGVGNFRQILESIKTLYLSGLDINWSLYHRFNKTKKVLLPSYPFQGTAFWTPRGNKSQSEKSESTSILEIKELLENQYHQLSRQRKFLSDL